MATVTKTAQAESRLATDVTRGVIVALTLATAVIHAGLGGLLFTLNAIGYTGLAILMVLPGPVGGVRVLVRLALLGFTAATIGGWLLFGARFPLAYLDNGLEVALVVAVAFELWRLDGGPIAVARRLRALASALRESIR